MTLKAEEEEEEEPDACTNKFIMDIFSAIQKNTMDERLQGNVSPVL